MSVLVKEMSMPSECEYCGFCRFYRENGRVWCNAKNRILKQHWDEPDWTYLNVKKPDWCPLVEVKTPHGRLIDVEDVKRRMIPLSFSVQKWIGEVELSNCMTVIGAEET